ncbi:MAG TPA: hypothetical protein VMH28_28040 [Candidatus Acidoferrales bacterium]|nr:hypothetical protein [Candidatus Acidoferrales bacterium]
MRSGVFYALAFGLLLTHPAHADVTMHSKLDYKLASYLPPTAAEAMNKQMADSLSNGVTLRIKGGRSITNSGPLQIITDRDKGTVTLLDSKTQRYATCPIAEYGDKFKSIMPEMPAEVKQMFENMKIDVNTSKTGKTGMVKNIKVEELVVAITMEAQGPMAAMMNTKVEMHLWAATNDELERLPALKEVAAYMARQATASDNFGSITKAFAQVPGFVDKLKPAVGEMIRASSGAVLRTQTKMMMPGSAKMMGAPNPDEPFTDLTTDLLELSDAAIADSVFTVPAGYKSVPIEDLVQLMNPLRGQGQQ